MCAYNKRVDLLVLCAHNECEKQIEQLLKRKLQQIFNWF